MIPAALLRCSGGRGRRRGCVAKTSPSVVPHRPGASGGDVPMFRVGRYTFKRAETAAEVEQVHALNYRTFVQEIPQHPDPGDGRLVDKFHPKNGYFVALRTGRVVGMIS